MLMQRDFMSSVTTTIQLPVSLTPLHRPQPVSVQYERYCQGSLLAIPDPDTLTLKRHSKECKLADLHRTIVACFFTANLLPDTVQERLNFLL